MYCCCSQLRELQCWLGFSSSIAYIQAPWFHVHSAQRHEGKRGGRGVDLESTSTCLADRGHVSSVSCMPSIAELSQQWGTCTGPSNGCSQGNFSLLVLLALLLWFTVPLPPIPEPFWFRDARCHLYPNRENTDSVSKPELKLKPLSANQNLWTFPYGTTFFSPCALDRAGDHWLTIRACNIKCVMTGHARSAFLI